MLAKTRLVPFTLYYVGRGLRLAVILSLPLQFCRAAEDGETERAFAQESAADVVVYYDKPTELIVVRPKVNTVFKSEKALLAHLAERKKPKKLLVVILSKRHKWSDPKQTVDGFWDACKKTGFDKVVIQLAHSSSRPILRE